MPVLNEALSSRQHIVTKPSPCMEPIGRQHKAEPQGAIAENEQDAADINSQLEHTSESQDGPKHSLETTKEEAVVTVHLPNDQGGNIRLLESISNEQIPSSDVGEKIMVDEETENEQLGNMNITEDGAEAEPAGAASAPLEVPDNQDSFSLPEDVPYDALTKNWRQDAEEERQQRGSVLDLYTLLDGPPRFFLEAC